MKQTIKERIEEAIKVDGYVVGCFNDEMESLSEKSLKEVIYGALNNEYSDILITHNRKKYIVELATVGSEKDFRLISKQAYQAQYGRNPYDEQKEEN